MSLKYGVNSVTAIKYNSNNVYKLIKDGTTTWCAPYVLHISKGTGVSSVSVRCNSTQEPSASTGYKYDSSIIYYGDSLSVSATASSGYTLDSYTTSYTVSGNITVSITAHSSYAYTKPGTDIITSLDPEIVIDVSNPNSTSLRCLITYDIEWDNGEAAINTITRTIAANATITLTFLPDSTSTVCYASCDMTATFVDSSGNAISATAYESA